MEGETKNARSSSSSNMDDGGGGGWFCLIVIKVGEERMDLTAFYFLGVKYNTSFLHSVA